MTSAVLESPLSLFAESHRVGTPGDRGATLEERLERALGAVRAEGVAECPVCQATMRLDDGAGRCTGCGSALA
jgi:hypothetical protein